LVWGEEEEEEESVKSRAFTSGRGKKIIHPRHCCSLTELQAAVSLRRLDMPAAASGTGQKVPMGKLSESLP